MTIEQTGQWSFKISLFKAFWAGAAPTYLNHSAYANTRTAANPQVSHTHTRNSRLTGICTHPTSAKTKNLSNKVLMHLAKLRATFLRKFVLLIRFVAHTNNVGLPVGCRQREK